MANKSTRTAPAPGASDAAATFADGFVDPTRPTAGAVTETALAATGDPLGTLREAEQVALQRDVLDPGSDLDRVMDGFILLVCGSPDFRRGGIAHPSRAEYPLNAFTQEQLDAFAAEPRIEMVTLGGGEPIAREVRMFGTRSFLLDQPRDPLLAGKAAENAISRPPNRAEPGMRNAVAGFSTR